MDKKMYDVWQKLLSEDGHLKGTDFFAFRLGWLECKASQQSVQPTGGTVAPANIDQRPEVDSAGEDNQRPATSG